MKKRKTNSSVENRNLPSLMVYGRSALKIEKGGDVSAAIENLVEAGFLAESGRINPETGRELRERRFRIRDNYARFYLKCVEPNKRIIDDGAFSFASLDQLEGWDSIMGLAFENMVVNNYRELIPHLHLGGAVIVSAGRLRWVLRRHRAVRFTASRQTIAIHYP